MPRPWRIEYCGAWYHVMNRGSARRRIFLSPLDKHYFLSLLEKIYDLFKVEIHAYCLMDNHYHLCVRTRNANLGKAIQYLQSNYTRYVNKLMKLDGPLFRGRYRAILVKSDRYLLCLSRYIHLNPVTANMVCASEHYQWSSALFYVTDAALPKWLFRNDILELFHSLGGKSYAEYLEKGVDDETQAFFSKTSHFPVFGEEDFVTLIKAFYMPTDNVDVFEIEAGVSLRSSSGVSILQIIQATADYFSIEFDAVRNRTTAWPDRMARKIAIYLAVKYSGKTQKGVSDCFNGTSNFGVSNTYRQIDNLVSVDSWVREVVCVIQVMLVSRPGSELTCCSWGG